MERNGLIYLDNAATSYPKPPEVYGEVVGAMLSCGGNAGRGSHKLALAAAQKLYECRELAAGLFGVGEPERVFFTLNTTYGLNAVIKGLLRRGDHVLLSDMEHNAVWRPIYKMASSGLIGYDVFKSYPDGGVHRAELICRDIARKLRRNTRLVVCTHQSNICSLSMPVREIAELCRRSGVHFLVDGAQSAGHAGISVDGLGLSALCVPAHKGLYGPQGCGMVLLGKGLSLSTLVEGGNGVNSLDGSMPAFSPERYEAGTLPMPTIAGLSAGLKFVRSVGEAVISEREAALFREAREGLSAIKGVRTYLPEHEGSVLLFNVDGVPADRVGELLDKRGICVRSGYHCAALGHRTLGTVDGGAVRASFGVFNDSRDVTALCEAVKEIADGV